LEINKILY